jgi:hypothetical protein
MATPPRPEKTYIFPFRAVDSTPTRGDGAVSDVEVLEMVSVPSWPAQVLLLRSMSDLQQPKADFGSLTGIQLDHMDISIDRFARSELTTEDVSSIPHH